MARVVNAAVPVTNKAAAHGMQRRSLPLCGIVRWPGPHAAWQARRWPAALPQQDCWMQRGAHTCTMPPVRVSKVQSAAVLERALW